MTAKVYKGKYLLQARICHFQFFFDITKPHTFEPFGSTAIEKGLREILMMLAMTTGTRKTGTV
jgi:hypothetical protein